MIDERKELKIQAYLDGELTIFGRYKVNRLLAHNAEARRLHAELNSIQELLHHNELDHPLPEDKESFRTRITHQLRVEGEGTSRVPNRIRPVLKWVAASAATALIIFAGVYSLMSPENSNQTPAHVLLGGESIEPEAANASFITFKSESAKLSVVWVDTKSSPVASPIN
ncbi:MAG: hypothetical protein K9N48_04665 [Verrucomicrobia bacterium]|nr:hypothetical protein [Verrucomicrobiota bacterium]MCF7707748.1 hypothetical protein [Verrucomicrobiota bacterium]